MQVTPFARCVVCIRLRSIDKQQPTDRVDNSGGLIVERMEYEPGRASMEREMIARVNREAVPPPIIADWDALPWRTMPTIRLQHHMGTRPVHFPRTSVRLAYDDTAVYVMFQVADRYVRAVAARHQEPVCGDSCVEFFFTPGLDVSLGYFNLEMNCGGTMLFHFHTRPRAGTTAIPTVDCDRIVLAHDLPRIVDPELQHPVTWTLGYALPVDLLAGYCPVVRPKAGVRWRANFYKCADRTSHPHWLTWAPVDHPKPDFHLPDEFGTMVFV